MKKLLIPIDLEINNYNAIDYLVSFFRNEVCEFYFLNTYTYNVDGLKAIDLLQAEDDWFEKPKIASEKCLGKVLERYAVNKGDSSHDFRAISKCGTLIEEIKKSITDINIDLVVLPGHSKAGGRTQKYSRNYKRIIENIRECPVMFIPSMVEMHTTPKFVLVSSFESELPKSEMEKWYELVKIANGSVKILTLSENNKMNANQKANLRMLELQLNMWNGNPITVQNIGNVMRLKNYVADNPDHIICIMDRKPDFWRKFGLKRSRITNLRPLPGNGPFFYLSTSNHDL